MTKFFLVGFFVALLPAILFAYDTEEELVLLDGCLAHLALIEKTPDQFLDFVASTLAVVEKTLEQKPQARMFMDQLAAMYVPEKQGASYVLLADFFAEHMLGEKSLICSLYILSRLIVLSVYSSADLSCATYAEQEQHVLLQLDKDLDFLRKKAQRKRFFHYMRWSFGIACGLAVAGIAYHVYQNFLARKQAQSDALVKNQQQLDAFIGRFEEIGASLQSLQKNLVGNQNDISLHEKQLREHAALIQKQIALGNTNNKVLKEQEQEINRHNELIDAQKRLGEMHHSMFDQQQHKINVHDNLITQQLAAVHEHAQLFDQQQQSIQAFATWRKEQEQLNNSNDARLLAQQQTLEQTTILIAGQKQINTTNQQLLSKYQEQLNMQKDTLDRQELTANTTSKVLAQQQKQLKNQGNLFEQQQAAIQEQLQQINNHNQQLNEHKMQLAYLNQAAEAAAKMRLEQAQLSQKGFSLMQQDLEKLKSEFCTTIEGLIEEIEDQNVSSSAVQKQQKAPFPNSIDTIDTLIKNFNTLISAAQATGNVVQLCAGSHTPHIKNS